MARKSLSVAEIRTKNLTILAVSEYETEYDNCIPSDDDGEIDEVVPALDISDEDADNYQKLLSKP